MCNNKCRRNASICHWCQTNYDVSTKIYKAATSTGGSVEGYLVKRKDGKIEGILSEDSDFKHLVYIKPNTAQVVNKRRK